MSFSNQLHVVVKIREPLDREEWMTKVARVLFSDDGKRTTNVEGKRGETT